VVILTHMGRPAGSYRREDYSLAPVARYLQKCLGSRVPVEFLPDCVGDEIERRTHNCAPGTVFLCENLRFHVEEVGTGLDAAGNAFLADPAAVRAFSAALGRLGDVYVFDAYACAHRPHASIALASVPVRVAGVCMHAEMRTYGRLLSAMWDRKGVPAGRDPRRPFVAVVGSAMKVRDKTELLLRLVDAADTLVVTGGMAHTFKAVQAPGSGISGALVDVEAARDVEKVLQRAAERGTRVLLPTDHMIAASLDPAAALGTCDDESGAPEGWLPLDLGPKSRAAVSAVVAEAETVVWVGTVGCYEWAPFAAGTVQLLTDMVAATARGATTVVCGGDAATAARRFFIGKKTAAEQVTFVSSGGGSSMVLLEGKMLHGAAVLSDKPSV
jgi:phosphoglycerate kinase